MGGTASSRHDGAMDNAVPLAELRNITVDYGPERVLDDVSFRLIPGEVHSLMGENGAGKSTLIKVLTGALKPSAGAIVVDGDRVVFGSPADALRRGISPVYQEIDLLPNLSVAENIFIGREPRKHGRIDWEQMRIRAAAQLADLGLTVEPSTLLGAHPVATQQLVAIARAISADVRILVLDEPTSSLDTDEVAELFRVIKELKQRGVAIVFISHFLDQVYEISDRITVLRDGRFVGEYLTNELLRVDLVAQMLGRELGATAVVRADIDVEDEALPVLEGDDLVTHGGLRGVSASLMAGEVLGVAGLRGSGRTALARAIAGIDRLEGGEVRLGGDKVNLANPRRALAEGIVYSSENRRVEGIIGELSVAENITLALQAQQGAVRRLTPARARELALSWIEALDIRPADPDRRAGDLSGGNQQKVMLARLLALAPRVVVLDEPTRGIDIGAKVEVQRLVGELADDGLAVMFISAELEEVLRSSHRVAILRDKKVVDILPSQALTIDTLLALVARPDDVED